MPSPAPAAPADVRGRVPPAVLAGEADLLRCPSFDRIYWEGSHTARMRREAAGVLGDTAHPDMSE